MKNLMNASATRFFILCGVVVAAAVSISAPETHAQSQTPCHLITPGMTLPAGFGAPWDTQSGTTPLLLSVTCSTNSATLALGTGSNLEYIYAQGYEYHNNQWRPFTFTGSNTAGQWLIARAQATLSRSAAELSQNNFLAAYVCTWNGAAWKCGCRDQACTQSYWQLQGFRYTEAGGNAFPNSVTMCSNPVQRNVTPTNIQNTIDSNRNGCLKLTLSPGRYGNIDLPALKGISFECSVPAKNGNTWHPNGCIVETTMRNSPGEKIGVLIIKNLVFYENDTPAARENAKIHDYGIRIYDVDGVSISDSVFQGEYNHEISTKERVGYSEIFNNIFIRCERHCLELGQNPSTAQKRTDSGEAVVKGNRFVSPRINAITYRNLQKLTVENNTFIDVAVNSIRAWPYWGLVGGEPNVVVAPPLRTIIRDNIFTGDNALLFEGRGITDDVVLIRGNTGHFSCRRIAMDPDTVKVFADEQTTNPPRLDPSSDISC